VFPLTLFPPNDFVILQAASGATEKRQWAEHGHKDTSAVWLDDYNRPAMPRFTFQYLAKLSHGQDHESKGGMVDFLNKYWSTVGFTVFIEMHCNKCDL
jgi:hypothetical protein